MASKTTLRESPKTLRSQLLADWKKFSQMRKLRTPGKVFKILDVCFPESLETSAALLEFFRNGDSESLHLDTICSDLRVIAQEAPLSEYPNHRIRLGDPEFLLPECEYDLVVVCLVENRIENPFRAIANLVKHCMKIGGSILFVHEEGDTSASPRRGAANRHAFLREFCLAMSMSSTGTYPSKPSVSSDSTLAHYLYTKHSETQNSWCNLADWRSRMVSWNIEDVYEPGYTLERYNERLVNEITSLLKKTECSCTGSFDESPVRGIYYIDTTRFLNGIADPFVKTAAADRSEILATVGGNEFTNLKIAVLPLIAAREGSSPIKMRFEIDSVRKFLGTPEHIQITLIPLEPECSDLMVNSESQEYLLTNNCLRLLAADARSVFGEMPMVLYFFLSEGVDIGTASVFLFCCNQWLSPCSFGAVFEAFYVYLWNLQAFLMHHNAMLLQRANLLESTRASIERLRDLLNEAREPLANLNNLLDPASSLTFGGASVDIFYDPNRQTVALSETNGTVPVCHDFDAQNPIACLEQTAAVVLSVLGEIPSARKPLWEYLTAVVLNSGDRPILDAFVNYIPGIADSLLRIKLSRQPSADLSSAVQQAEEVFRTVKDWFYYAYKQGKDCLPLSMLYASLFLFTERRFSESPPTRKVPICSTRPVDTLDGLASLDRQFGFRENINLTFEDNKVVLCLPLTKEHGLHVSRSFNNLVASVKSATAENSHGHRMRHGDTTFALLSLCGGSPTFDSRKRSAIGLKMQHKIEISFKKRSEITIVWSGRVYS